MNGRFQKTSSGFTLIEVIITVTLFGLVAAMVAPFMGTMMTRSSEPVVSVQEGLTIGKVMSDLLADYKEDVDNDALDLDTFKTTWDGHTESGVTVDVTFIEYQRVSWVYTDSDSDGVYDPVDQEDTVTDLLLVTISKSPQQLSVVLGDDQ